VKKWIISSVLIILLFLSWSKILDTKATQLNIETTKDVATTLAITRSINAGLSVIENSSLLVGVGVQADVAIGEVVNPINDFLDRFSWILLFSLISLGIQNLIIVLSQTILINTILTITILSTIFSFYKQIKFSNFLYKFLIFIIFIRFAIPSIQYINGYIYQHMMAQKVVTIQQKNEKFNKEIQKFIPNSEITKKTILNLENQLHNLKQKKQQILDNSLENSSYFDKLKAKINYNNTSISDRTKKELLNIDNKIKIIELKIDKVDINPLDKIKLFAKKIEHNMDMFFTNSYTMIIIFLSNGIIFPLLFLWGFIKLGKEIFNIELKGIK